MTNRTCKHRRFLSAAFIILSAAVLGAGLSISSISSLASPASLAAQSKTNERKPEVASEPAASPSPRPRENKKPPDTTRYSYEFTQPEFFIRHIVIEHDATGRGKITFQRKGEEVAIEEPVELSIGALGRVLDGWTQLRFLESTEDYQSEKQFAHLGTMRLKMEHDEQRRTAEFNWTNNKLAASLANEYRRVADQAVLIFDISVARETQPLATPKLMDEVELQVKRNGLSDPQQLVPLLNDISTDEHLPLIARNHAIRLLKTIDK